jgi:hypothetical protein
MPSLLQLHDPTSLKQTPRQRHATERQKKIVYHSS